MTIFDFLVGQRFVCDDINLDNFAGSLPRNQINFNDSNIKAVLRECYFLDEDEFLKQVTAELDKEFGPELTFFYENQGSRFLGASDGQYLSLDDLIFNPYVSDGKISSQAFFHHLNREINRTWHKDVLDSIIEKQRKLMTRQNIEDNSAKLYNLFYENAISQMSRILKNSREQTEGYIKEFNVDLNAPFPNVLPNALYEHLSNENQKLLKLNMAAHKLVGQIFDKETADAIYSKIRSLNETCKAKQEHYLEMNNGITPMKVAVDCEVLLLNVDRQKSISTLYISLPVLKSTKETSEDEEEKHS